MIQKINVTSREWRVASQKQRFYIFEQPFKSNFMKIQKYEDLIVWDKSQSIAVDIYRCLKENKDYSFKDQIQRASVSISNNIA